MDRVCAVGIALGLIGVGCGGSSKKKPDEQSAADAAVPVCEDRGGRICENGFSYPVDSCGEVIGRGDTCGIAGCNYGHCCTEAVAGGAFDLPSHATYTLWRFADEEHASIEYDLTFDNDPVASDSVPNERVGLYVAHSGYVGETQFYFGFQTTMSKPGEDDRIGKGIIFSRWDERDLEHARPAEGGFTQSSGHEGDFIGVRLEYDWRAASYKIKLSREDGGDAVGDWFRLDIEEEAGESTFLGALRFPRPEPDVPATISGGGVFFTEVFSMPKSHEGDPDYSLVPRWQLAAMATADGDRPGSADMYYPAYPRDQEYPNANVYFDKERDRVTMEFGGDTMKCVGAGQLF